VSAGRRNFQGALDVLLAFDFGEIIFVVVGVREDFFDVHLGRRQADFAFQKLRGLAKILHGDDLQSGDHSRLGGVFGGHERADFSIRLRLERDGQNAFHRTHAAGQREFTDDDKIIELVGLDLFAGGQHSNRNRQIEAWPFFFHIGGRKVDGGFAHRKFVAGIGERGGDAVLGFLDRRVRQADECDEGFAVTAVHLYLDGVSVNPVQGCRTNLG
jgi:hypothetical protein